MFIVGDMILNYTGTGLRSRAGSATAPARRRRAGVYQAGRRQVAVDRRVQPGDRQAAVRRDGPARADRGPALRHQRGADAAQRRAAGDRRRRGSPTRPRAEILKVLDEYEVVCVAGQRRQRHRRGPALPGADARRADRHRRRSARCSRPGRCCTCKDYAGPTYDGVPRRSASTPTRSSPSCSADRRDGVQTHSSGPRPDPLDCQSWVLAASRTAAKGVDWQSTPRWRRLKPDPDGHHYSDMSEQLQPFRPIGRLLLGHVRVAVARVRPPAVRPERSCPDDGCADDGNSLRAKRSGRATVDRRPAGAQTARLPSWALAASRTAAKASTGGRAPRWR